jgi:repressor LexA
MSAMMSIGKKIKLLREDKNINQNELARQIGINASVMSRIESGKRQVDHDLLKKICHALNVSSDLLIDDSSIYPTKINKPTYKRTNNVPILGTIRAGLPLLAEDNWLGDIELPEELQADFALKVIGDSMSWSGINDGDLAILAQVNLPRHGMIVAAGVEDLTWDATLKFYIERNGQKFLKAANPDFDDIPITNKHRIIGYVVKIYKNPPELQNYQLLLIAKEIEDKGWREAIDIARSYGLDGNKIKKMIELYSIMFKHLD